MSFSRDNTLLSAINVLHTPRSSTETGRTASTSVPRNFSTSTSASKTSTSSKKSRFSFRSLFPDLRTETMLANEQKRREHALARGQREQTAYEQAVAQGSSEQVLRMFADHKLQPKLRMH